MAVWLFRVLPLSLGIRIGGLLGRVAYYLLLRERRRALEHLDIALEEFGEMKMQPSLKKAHVLKDGFKA